MCRSPGVVQIERVIRPRTDLFSKNLANHIAKADYIVDSIGSRSQWQCRRSARIRLRIGLRLPYLNARLDIETTLYT